MSRSLKFMWALVLFCLGCGLFATYAAIFHDVSWVLPVINFGNAGICYLSLISVRESQESIRESRERLRAIRGDR